MNINYGPPHVYAGFPDADYFKHATLRRQYFPNVKTEGEELPPIFSTETFSDEVAGKLRGIDKKAKYGWIVAKSRRYDGLTRELGIPHPVPYSRLVLHMADHWPSLAHSLRGDRAMISPAIYSDLRIIRMDYGEFKENGLEIDIQMALGARYLVQADIGNFFPSVYSHSIDWALRGKESAKNNQRQGWEAELDKYICDCAHGESKGLHIGPAVSNIISEIVLQKVDEKLSGYRYVRFVDDYRMFCETRSEAEEFLRELQYHANEYRLALNTRKSRIVNIEKGFESNWIFDVRSFVPRVFKSSQAVEYLRRLEVMARDNPDASVLKFGVKTYINGTDLPDGVSVAVLGELVRISSFNPHILPNVSCAIAGMDAFALFDASRWAVPTLEKQLRQAAENRETDTVLWICYILVRQLAEKIDEKCIEAIVANGDDLTLLGLLHLVPESVDRIVAHVNSSIYAEPQDYDSHWLIRYELFRRGANVSLCGERERQWMSVLKNSKVKFTQS